MEEQKVVDSFDDFAKDLEKKDDGEKDLKEITIDKLVEIDGESLKCPYPDCEWKTHKGSKDKKRGMKNHMKKCIFNPNKKELEPDENIPIQQSIPRRNFKVNIETKDKKEEVVEELFVDKESERLKLVGDLDILKIKFDSIPFNWNYTTNSSIQHLKRQKSLFLRMLNDEAGTQAMFKLLVISSKAVEKVADVSNMLNLDGYAQDVNEAHEEIYPILKNLVDTGVISVSHLTPEMRLGMIMASLAVSRIEKNKIQRNDFLAHTSEVEEEWQ